MIQKGVVVLASGMGIGANTFHRGKALSRNLVVAYQISCEHLPDEIRDTPVRTLSLITAQRLNIGMLNLTPLLPRGSPLAKLDNFHGHP